MTRSRAATVLSSLSVKVVIALLLGLGVGAAVQAWGGPRGESGVEVVEALGGVWLNALRITVIPLIFALESKLEDIFAEGLENRYARHAQLNLDAQQVMDDQILAERESVSGVNLDEEATNMLRFQQAYQAAAQVIATADTMFQALLGAVRR